jgi:hypothetical protein
MRACVQSARCVLIIILAVFTAAAGFAFDAAAESTVRREILALYDSGREAQPDETLIHKLAEMPLNHLGYIVRYHDVREPLPEVGALQRYRAVLTWFEAPLAPATAYLDWGRKAAAAGARFVILGETGGNPFSGDLALVNTLIANIGLQHAGQVVGNTLGTRVVGQDASLIGFERPLDIVLPPYPILRAGKMSPHVGLEVEPAGHTGLKTSILVATSAGGGFAATGHIYYYDRDANRLKWIINPFAFFRHALGHELFPIPDVTTISGRRLYFSHVDGNGWNNAVQIEGYRERGAIAAEVLENELIAPYPDLPVTVGLIAGNVDETLGGRAESGVIATRLFALPHVEIASNTYTYPLVWSAFENSSRNGPAYGKQEDPSVISAVVSRLAGKVPAGPAAVNRVYTRDPFDLSIEVAAAVALAQSLAPPRKGVPIYAWSGDNRPFAAAVAAARDAGLRNINGGGTRLNAHFPSVAYVSPISRPVSGERQIYAVGRNENHYFDDMGRPNYAFANLKETIHNTGSPRRLTGIDLYYTVHSAERPATLSSVKSTLELVRNLPLAPINTSEYAAIADGFFAVEIHALGESRWLIRNRGAVQTLRLDDADTLELDPTRSKGAIGQNRHEHALYIALDAAVDEPIVALRPTSASDPGTGGLGMLVESRWRVRSVSAKKCDLNFVAQGFGNGEFVWAGVEPGRHIVAVSRDGQPLWRQTAEVVLNRRLTISIPISALDPVDIGVRCMPPESTNEN